MNHKVYVTRLPITPDSVEEEWEVDDEGYRWHYDAEGRYCRVAKHGTVSALMSDAHKDHIAATSVGYRYAKEPGTHKDLDFTVPLRTLDDLKPKALEETDVSGPE